MPDRPPASLAATLLHYAAFSTDDIQQLESMMRPRPMAKGEYFIRQGQNGDRLAFVQTGIFRIFYTEEDGREATRAFMMEGGFLTSWVSIIRGEPSPFTIEALEDSTLLIIPASAVHSLATASPVWMQFLATLSRKRLDYKDRRIKGFLTKDALGRYLDFLEEYPGIETRVRQHHIASYLGVTPVSLSRLRRRFKKRQV